MEAPAADRPTWRPIINRSALWTAVWALLAILHVTQAIWLSHGKAAPGDLGDGRFNQLILEHGYQSLRGVYDWDSPSQFFPQRATLTYNDTHAGTLPIYAFLRVGGLSMEHAWQAWFVVIATLNVLAATRLFTALGIARSLRGPLVFAACASAVMVWLAGSHMQMLPFFPVLFAWGQLVRWQDDRNAWRLAAAGGWFAWQFAAGPYLGFFAAVLTLAMGAIALVCRLAFGRPETGSAPAGPVSSRWAAVIIGAVGCSLGLAAALIYRQSAGAGVARSMQDVVFLAPDFPAWFTAPRTHFWWPAGWPGGNPDLDEHAWLAGFLPLLLLPAALVLGWRKRQTVAGRWLLMLGVGALVVAAFFTKWGAHDSGAWLALSGHFPTLRAFRASGRIAPLLFLMLVAATGLFLTCWQSRASSGRWRLAPVSLAILIALETLGHHQPAMTLSVAKARADAVIAAWKAAGDRPVLAYAFGYANQPEAWLHLDAWSAALRLKRATLNGYTGGVPSALWSFIWNSTPENARAVIAQTGLDPARVSIVESLGPAAEAAIGLERYPHKPVSTLTGFDLQPDQWTLFAPLEFFSDHDVTMYQFTPPAEVRFRLPDSATRVEFLQEMRAGSYDHGGQSDGVGITWLVAASHQPESVVWREYFNPRDVPAHRGMVSRQFALPPGAGRILILRTDSGPAHDSRWDWPLFGNLKVH